jgi:hypothetical protein
LQSQATKIVEVAQESASGLVQSASETARNLAEQQKSAAAEQIEDVGKAVESAAEAIERGIPQAGPLVRQAASTIRDASSALRDRNVEELMDIARDFARRNPVAFLGGTLLTGIALARFLKSSADRREAARSQGARLPARPPRQGGGTAEARSSGAGSQGGGSNG